MCGIYKQTEKGTEMKRLIYAEDAREQIDKWLDSVGWATIGKNTGYYGELLGCIEDAPTATAMPEEINGINIAEALEKQMPKKRIYAGAAACPTCRKILLYHKHESMGHYCKWCGQRLEDEE